MVPSVHEVHSPRHERSLCQRGALSARAVHHRLAYAAGWYVHVRATGVPGSFEQRLAYYVRAAEYLLALAIGSIVLLVGSSVIHATGKLPWVFASPLIFARFLRGLWHPVHRVSDLHLRRVPASHPACLDCWASQTKPTTELKDALQTA